MVTTTSPIPALSGITPTAAVDAVPRIDRPLAVPQPPDAPDVAELSQLGTLLSRLTDLQSSDPERARRSLLAISSELAGRAALSGGDAQLRALANAFARAAETGDLSEVRPPGPPRADELIEGTALNTATTQGQVTSYALGEEPGRPELGSLLDGTLSPAALEQRRA